MNFKISKKKFYDALQIVSHVIAPNSPLPSLSCILVQVEENRITLTASDNDISIQKILSNDTDEDLNLTVIEEGSITMDARYLLEIVRKIDSDTISIEIIDGALTRFSGTLTEFKINGMRSSNYPKIDFSVPADSFSLPAADMLTLIEQTSFAVSAKETRPVLTGVNFKMKGNVLECTATDSYRLAKKTIQLGQEASFCITIPAKTLKIVSSIIFNEEDINIAISQKKVQFRFDHTILQSSLLEGEYPETERLIPASFTYSLTLDREDLINAIDRTSFIKNDNMTIIRLQCSKEEIVMMNKSQEIGESREILHADKYEGDPLDISFSGKYVSEAAKALKGQSIKIEFTGEMKPFVLENTMDNTILQLVLPVRTYN